MKAHIENFSTHLNEALEIGEKANLKASNSKFQNIIICGLGGSGIGGSIVSQLVAKKVSLPIIINKDYDVPSFIGSDTLAIMCSYSGNTEETLIMLEKIEKTGAEIACITSGGKLAEIAAEKQYNCIQIPGEFPPRAALGYSLPQLFFILNHYGIIDTYFINELKKGIELMDSEEENIRIQADAIANQLAGKIPIIYADASYEGVAVRFRQQINENSKMLCWHHVIPEMNHNELVGWKIKNEQVAVIILRNEDDYFRTQKRMEINKSVFNQYTSTILEAYSKGESAIEKSLYLIHLGDWVSMYLAEIQQIDATEVNVIAHLKAELSKI